MTAIEHTEAPPARRGRRDGRQVSLTTLALSVAVLGLVLMGLATAVLAVKLQPPAPPITTTEAELRALEQAAAAYPESAAVHTALGTTLLDLDRAAEARDAFERAVAADPEDWPALLQLGLLVEADDPARARELFERSSESAPTRSKVSAYVALGDLLFAQGDPAGAREAYEDAVADAPILIEGRLGLARSLELLGDRTGALEQYREVDRYAPGDPEVAEAIARLEAGDP